MSRLCTPVLFGTLDIRDTRNPDRLASLASMAPRLSPYLKNVTIAPRDLKRFLHTIATDDAYLTILSHAVNLRKLCVLYDSTDMQCHGILAPLHRTLTHLDTLEFWEITATGLQDQTAEIAQKVFRTYFLDSYLHQTPPSQLHSLTVVGSIPLTRDTLQRVKERPALRSLYFRRAVSVEDREWFSDWSPRTGKWACAMTLTSLTLVNNHGVHCSAIVNLIASGSISECLESLTMHWCGHGTDAVNLPDLCFQRGTWAPRKILRRLELDHFFNWEMESLRFLKARECFLTRCGSSSEIMIRMMSDNSAFSGVERLNVTALWQGDVWENLRKACNDRGVVVDNSWKPSDGHTCTCEFCRSAEFSG